MTDADAAELRRYFEPRKLEVAATCERWGVYVRREHGRVWLAWPSGGAIRLRSLNDEAAQRGKYAWSPTGGHSAHWYGLERAAERIVGGASVLYIVNGAPSVWACDAAGVAAVAPSNGENEVPEVAPLVDLVREHGAGVYIAYDADEAGGTAARCLWGVLLAEGISQATHKIAGLRNLELDHAGTKTDVGDLFARDPARFAEQLAICRDRVPRVVSLKEAGGIGSTSTLNGTIPQWALALPIPANARLVLCAILMHANETEQRGCRAGAARIGSTTGLSRRTAEKHIQLLNDLGVIVSVKSGRGFDRRLNPPHVEHPLLRIAERDRGPWLRWLSDGRKTGWDHGFRP